MFKEKYPGHSAKDGLNGDEMKDVIQKRSYGCEWKGYKEVEKLFKSELQSFVQDEVSSLGLDHQKVVS